MYQSSASLNVDRLFTHIYCTQKKEMNVYRPRFIFPIVFSLFNICMYMFIVIDAVFLWQVNCIFLFLSAHTYIYSYRCCSNTKKKKQLTNFPSLWLSSYLSFSYAICVCTYQMVNQLRLIFCFDLDHISNDLWKSSSPNITRTTTKKRCTKF